MSDEKRVSDEMGGLLWRRVYQARARLEMIEPVWPQTLEAVLRQAGIPEPDDDAVFGKGTEVVHGRDLPAAAAVPVDGEARIPDPGLTREEATSIGPGFGPITEATPCACGAIQPCHYCPVNASARAKLRASLAAADKGENE